MATNAKPTNAKPTAQQAPQQAAQQAPQQAAQQAPQQAAQQDAQQDAKPTAQQDLSPAERLLQELQAKMEEYKRALLAEKLAAYTDRIDAANKLIAELIGAGFTVRLEGGKLVADVSTPTSKPTSSSKSATTPKEKKNRSWAILHNALIAAGIKPAIILPKTEEVVDLLQSGLVRYEGKEVTPTKAAMHSAGWPSANAWEVCRLANVTGQPRCGDWYDDNVVS